MSQIATVDQTMSAIVTADDKFRLTDTGLYIAPDVTFEEWFGFGKKLSRRYSQIQWMIGDWLNFGEHKFGEKYAQAVDGMSFSHGTLRNYASIAARVPAQVRNPALKFHQAKHVAKLETPAEQKRIQAFAVEQELTGDEIEDVVREVLGKPSRKESTLTGHVIRVENGNWVVAFGRPIEVDIGQMVTVRLIE